MNCVAERVSAIPEIRGYKLSVWGFSMTGSTVNDPRLYAPQCVGLQPVRTVHENPWFSVRDRGGYFTTEYAATQVAVLPIVDDHSILLVRVKRPVIDDTPYELPAGAAQADEAPAVAVARELLEETGIGPCDPDRFVPQPPIAVSSNRTPIMPHIFQISLTQSEVDSRQPHDHEIESVEQYRFDEVRRMIAESNVYIGLAVAILARFLFQQAYQECRT